MPDITAARTESREMRLFLSSTFRDFMEEWDLLAKQVFPALSRRARERVVEVVDVDLRWGITEEESEQGRLIPICLAEIDRYRPDFIGIIGERYGWISPEQKYPAELLERQLWLNSHLGGVSFTELEILHGVLIDPAMAGRPLFYFRNSANSDAKASSDDLGWSSVSAGLDLIRERLAELGPNRGPVLCINSYFYFWTCERSTLQIGKIPSNPDVSSCLYR